ncbi:hypothetical protein [Miltoncostaea oceani]|uniref:hypothetical protein n=1 Tax=Miltoncostaea oceani TaxID=2843216 RepID=UPI001C3E02E7|nr:hypothetical protein [Miltoncostaea oceani]
MTVWAWVAGFIASVAGAWVGAGPLDSNGTAAVIGIGVALIWTCFYWFRLDRTEWPDLSLGQSIALAMAVVPVGIALSFALGIADDHKLWFCLSVAGAVELLGVPTTRFRVDQPGRDWD